MELAVLGMGRMGLNMAHRLCDFGHKVFCWNRTSKHDEVNVFGGHFILSIDGIAKNFTQSRRVYIIMVPAGDPVDEMINEIMKSASAGDIIIDGGNSNYKDSAERAGRLAKKGFSFMDCGTSGGVWGYKNGYCLMIGGLEADFKFVEPAFRDLAIKDGCIHAGPHGSGHYVKMIHNGIEYGMLQAYGEGFELLKKSEFGLDLHKISKLWNNGSVVRSWLLELLENSLSENPSLEGVKGFVEDSGEGRWTVLDAIEKSVPAPVITMSLLSRFTSRQDESFSAKIIAALRNQFGGHNVKKD